MNTSRYIVFGYTIRAHAIRSAVKPVAVFSGDDHDNCLVHHRFTANGGHRHVPERTIATFSWLQGNLRPSFGVVLQQRMPRAQLHTVICFLPPQMLIYTCYVVLLLLTVVAAMLFTLSPAGLTTLTILLYERQLLQTMPLLLLWRQLKAALMLFAQLMLPVLLIAFCLLLLW